MSRGFRAMTPYCSFRLLFSVHKWEKGFVVISKLLRFLSFDLVSIISLLTLFSTYVQVFAGVCDWTCEHVRMFWLNFAK